MINLPHQKPIRFVNHIVEKNDNYAIVSALFPTVPTLAMVCEAAAQSSAAFADEAKIGYLISLKDCQTLKSLDKTIYQIKVIRVSNMDAIYEFEFNLLDNDSICVSGSFMIKLL